MRLIAMSAAAALFSMVGAANAALVEFQTFNGNYGLSTDGWGSSSISGVISAQADAGSTVVAAYLYTGTNNTSSAPAAVTLNGVSVSYNNTSILPSPACCNLRSHRADVTSIVSGVINGGAGGVYDFDINEGTTSSSIDGHALVVVYRNPALPEASIGILDGFARVDGDTTSINFSEPLDPTDPGFRAEMYLGINFSCCSQRSTVEVNGQLLTENAGNFDDGTNLSNGSLITVGSFDDPFSPMLPSYEEDREKYNLVPFINSGDTSITVETFNSSRDDNIFLAAFYVTGEAGFNEPPPNPGPVIPLPAGVFLLGGALGGLGLIRRRRKSA